MSVAVRGGAVGYLQEVFNNSLEHCRADDKLLGHAADPVGADQTWRPDEFSRRAGGAHARQDVHAGAPSGEKGVLEAYLRAIHFAERFIYIENQYFNNDTITEALVDASAQAGAPGDSAAQPAPDMPLYLGWQQKAIGRIAGFSARRASTAATRLGVFSAWTHEGTDCAPVEAGAGRQLPAHQVGAHRQPLGNGRLRQSRRRVARLHAVRASRFFDGDVRNTEGEPRGVRRTRARLCSAVDALRRQLWSEHLASPDPSDARARTIATGKDWLEVWRQRAAAKRAALKNRITTCSPIRVLECPAGRDSKTVSHCRTASRARDGPRRTCEPVQS